MVPPLTKPQVTTMVTKMLRLGFTSISEISDKFVYSFSREEWLRESRAFDLFDWKRDQTIVEKEEILEDLKTEQAQNIQGQEILHKRRKLSRATPKKKSPQNQNRRNQLMSKFRRSKQVRAPKPKFLGKPMQKPLKPKMITIESSESDHPELPKIEPVIKRRPTGRKTVHKSSTPKSTSTQMPKPEPQV